MEKLPIRKFTTVAKYLREPVEITNDGQSMGVFTPANSVLNSVSTSLPASVNYSVTNTAGTLGSNATYTLADANGTLNTVLDIVSGETNTGKAR